MKILRHGRFTKSEMRRVYTCVRCKCAFMPDAQEETKTHDRADYAAECPDCGKLCRNYRMEDRVVLEVSGEALRKYFEEENAYEQKGHRDHYGPLA